MPEVQDLDHLDGFDASNDLHVDQTARVLLERFRRHQDTEAFTLLFELTQSRLARIAERITRKMCPAADPDDLVSSFMARLFSDVGARQRSEVRHFLGLAHTAMRNDLFDQMRSQKRAIKGVQRYQDTLRLPADPADEAQHSEQDARLSDYGETVVRLTDECFHTLPTRDKHVLVAREILGLSYDRVASLLHLDVDQIGMIIRRARDQLAKRLLDRLSQEEHLPDDGLDEAKSIVLRCLGSKERVKNVRSLVTNMLDRSATAGRQRLADLVYELAKSCLLRVPDFEDRTLVHQAPRRRDIVAGDVHDLAGRLQGLHNEVDVSHLTSTPSSDLSALDETRQCLATLRALEGESGRQQVARALTDIYAGELTEAEARLRGLIDADLAPLTRQNVFRNLTLALLRQDRFADALDVCEASGDEWPDDPVRIMNACFASARLSDEERFETYVQWLIRRYENVPEERVRRWIEREVPQLARDMGLPNARIRELTTLRNGSSDAGEQS